MHFRIPTTKEWDHLMDITHENNNIVHWKNILSWVHDQDLEREIPSHHMHRGYYSAYYWHHNSASYRGALIGFRPAFDGLTPDALAPNKNGVTVIGTLYMGGKPVKVPQDPTCSGDIQDYIPGTMLDFGPALEDPAYQVTAIKVGNVFISDRALLKNISYEDIDNALAQKPET